MIIFTMKNIKFFVVALFALICATSCEQDNEGTLYTPVAQNISFETKKVSVLTAEECNQGSIYRYCSVSF